MKMKIGVRKGGIKIKYQELWERLSSHQDFEPLVKKLRIRFGVDPRNQNTFERVVSKNYPAWEDAVYDILFALIPKYMTPEGNFLYTALESYAFGGPEQVKTYFDEGIGYSLGIKIFNKSSEIPTGYKDGVFIFLPPYVSKTNLIEAVGMKWKEIEKILDKKNRNNHSYKKLKNLRVHSNWERDRLVYDIYNQSRQNLGLKKGELKNFGVSRILREDYDIHNVSPENVKTIVSRQKKLRKGYS